MRMGDGYIGGYWEGRARGRDERANLIEEVVYWKRIASERMGEVLALEADLENVWRESRQSYSLWRQAEAAARHYGDTNVAEFYAQLIDDRNGN